MANALRTLNKSPRKWKKYVDMKGLIVYGEDGTAKVVGINKWDKGQWAVDIGKEIKTKGQSQKYKWTEPNYFSGKKTDAVRVAKEYMRR